MIHDSHLLPVRTQRWYNVYDITLGRRCVDVKTTLCAYWVWFKKTVVLNAANKTIESSKYKINTVTNINTWCDMMLVTQQTHTMSFWSCYNFETTSFAYWVISYISIKAGSDNDKPSNDTRYL